MSNENEGFIQGEPDRLRLVILMDADDSECWVNPAFVESLHPQLMPDLTGELKPNGLTTILMHSGNELDVKGRTDSIARQLMR